MRRVLVAGLAMLGAATLSAQSVAPIPPAQNVNLLEEVQSSELRVGLHTLIASRTSVMTGAGTATATGTLTGFDLFARTDGIGVYGRSLTGTFAAGAQGLAGEFVVREVGLLIGSPTLSLQGGWISRTSSALNDPRDHSMWRGGARTFWEIGSSAVQVTLSAGVRFGKAPSGGDITMQFLGVDGDAQVVVQAPRGLPIYVLAGWHYERFDDAWSPVARTEELTGPMLGIGFRLAAKPFVR